MNFFKSRYRAVARRPAGLSTPWGDLLGVAVLLGAGAAIIAAAWAWRHPRGVSLAAPAEPHEIDRWSNEGGPTAPAVETTSRRHA